MKRLLVILSILILLGSCASNPVQETNNSNVNIKVEEQLKDGYAIIGKGERSETVGNIIYFIRVKKDINNNSEEFKDIEISKEVFDEIEPNDIYYPEE